MAKVTSLWHGLDEPELVERARIERDAFGELYRRHYEAIGRYLHRRTGCRHATEDLLSEVFLAAMNGLPRFRHRGVPVRHWLYRIATRAANRWARRAARRPAQLGDRGVVDGRGEGDTDPRAERVVAALLALKPKHQAVLTLHYVEGLSVGEVARVLRTRPGTVKSRLARARDALRVRLPGGRS